MLFQKTIVKKYLALLPNDVVAEAWQKYQLYFLDKNIQANIQQSKEEQFQEGFLRELFVKILGYTLNPSPDYNLITEQKNETNAKKADGAILLDGKVIGVVELKDHKTTDLTKIEAQAFGYKSQHIGTRLVVISNFEKLRLYIDNAVDHREWSLFTLKEEDFRELYLCLSWEQVKAGKAIRMKEESVSSEDQITKALYRDYSQFKRALFANIVEQNPEIDQLLLFKKTQKLLDRLLFIFFAEDCGLLPPNSMVQIIDQWEKLKEMDEYRPFYERVKKYFGYMNTGFQGKKYEIFAYNGGLFKPDEVLDNIKITDEILVEHTRRLSTYDFESDVDVNILGHIFENSLTEIEEVTQQITNGEAPQTSRRKQDGVFYTPQYITKYIVENTVGKLCAEKKQELGIIEEEYYSDQRRQMHTKQKMLERLDQYREWLEQITILDPACGSGAFLNAALRFLIDEHKLVYEMQKKVTGYEIPFDKVENSILEHNLYGVDINEESVEIAQLSLWLRTAKPHRKLNTLSENIKCGNSLISDPDIAGDKAFDWHKEFPQVFRLKAKKVWHIVTATHDSRTSQRMIDYQVRELRYNGTKPDAEPVELTQEEELKVCEVVDKIVKEDHLNVVAFNVCRDHFHMLLVCEEKDVDDIVRKIKSKTAIAINKLRDKKLARGLAPLSERAIWTQKYGCNEIREKEHFQETMQYIENNRIKHNLPPLPSNSNKGASPLANITFFNNAFKAEYEGGFDVVIGNPPYVHLESVLDTSNQLEKIGYTTYNKRGDIYCLFVEKAFQLAKPNGYVSYIMSNKWLQAAYGKELRSFFLGKQLDKLIDFGDIQIFEGATTYPCIFIGRNATPTSQLSVSVLKAANSQDFNYNVVSTEDLFDFSQFSSDSWVISSKKEKILLDKLSKNNPMLKEIVGGEAYRGVLTGLTEAFLIDSNTYQKIVGQDERAKEHIYPFLQGRHVSPYGKAEAVNYLILFEKGWTKCSYYEMNNKGACPLVSEEEAWNYVKSQYPSIASWLEPFAEKGRKRTDKGDYWWELRACDYYDQFAKPKIMYQAFQVRPCFIYDEQSFYSNNSMWFIPESNNGACPIVKPLLAILNSQMGWWLITKHCTQIQNGYQLIWRYFGQIPVPELIKEQASLLSQLADRMLTLNEELQEKRGRFLRRLVDNLSKGACPHVKVTTALQTFDQLDFKAFVAELKKQKIKLSLIQQDEWEEYFNQYKSACNDISNQISATDNKIDQCVFDLYELTPKEREIVMGG